MEETTKQTTGSWRNMSPSTVRRELKVCNGERGTTRPTHLHLTRQCARFKYIWLICDRCLNAKETEFRLGMPDQFCAPGDDPKTDTRTTLRIVYERMLPVIFPLSCPHIQHYLYHTVVRPFLYTTLVSSRWRRILLEMESNYQEKVYKLSRDGYVPAINHVIDLFCQPNYFASKRTIHDFLTTPQEEPKECQHIPGLNAFTAHNRLWLRDKFYSQTVMNNRALSLSTPTPAVDKIIMPPPPSPTLHSSNNSGKRVRMTDNSIAIKLSTLRPILATSASSSSSSSSSSSPSLGTATSTTNPPPGKKSKLQYSGISGSEIIIN